MTFRRFWLVGLAAAWLLAMVSWVAVGHGNHVSNHDFPEFSFPYTKGKDDSNCNGGAVDPITVVFYGWYADAATTAMSVENHTGWNDESGSRQHLKVHMGGGNYNCHEDGPQRASQCGICDRFHIRLWRIPSATGGHKKTVGDPHHEDAICYGVGHAVDENGATGSGFDRGRRTLRQDYTGPGGGPGHHTDSVYWGNTRNFAQCDATNTGADAGPCPTGPATSDYCDGWAGSNGNGVRISIDHYH